jgi:hypothetical protein
MIRRAALSVFWLLLGLICVWTFAPVGLRPQTGHPALERFAAFFAMGGALALGCPRRPLLAAAIVCAIAVGSEALQIVIPFRDARPIDAVEKLLGGAFGTGAMLLVAVAHRRVSRA